MNQTTGLLLAGSLLFLTPAIRAAQKPASVARNLEWAGATLDNMEKDLAEVVQDNRLTDTNSLVPAFLSARSRLASLRRLTTGTAADPGDLSKAIEFAKNVAGVPQSVLDRIGELDQKREAYRKLIADNPSLSETDIGKRFDDAYRSLAGDLMHLTVCQLEEKPLEAGEAEGEWNLQALRCDQIIEEGTDEAAYLVRKEELKRGVREAGKTISLDPLDSAREQVRITKRRQQEAALEKQKLANQISQLNLQTQLLQEKAGKLDEAASQAGEAYDQAQDKIQQRIDQESQ
jgi:hypothetical protein